MSEWTFSGVARCRIELPAGSVHLVGGDGDDVRVDLTEGTPDLLRVEQRGDTLTITPAIRNLRRRIGLVITQPPGLSVDASLASADLRSDVALAEATLKVASGDITLDDIGGRLAVKAASGSLSVRDVGADVDATMASGDVDVAGVGGSFRVRSASGDVRAARVDGDLQVKTASGDVSVGDYEGSRLQVKTMSGDVTLGVPSGRTVEVDIRSISGTVKSELERSNSPRTGHLDVEIVTMSGNVRLVRAQEKRS